MRFVSNGVAVPIKSEGYMDALMYHLKSYRTDMNFRNRIVGQKILEMKDILQNYFIPS